MLQFGELLTLGLGAVTATYLLLHRRPIANVAGLGRFVLPFVLMAVAMLATVLEGVPGASDAASIIFWERSPDILQRSGWIGAALNVVEHATYLGAAVVLLVVIWRQRRGAKGAGSP